MKRLVPLIFILSIFADFTPGFIQLGSELFSGVDHCHKKSLEQSDSDHEEERHCDYECHMGHTHVAIFNQFPSVKEGDNSLKSKNKLQHITLKPRNFINEVSRPPIS